MADIVELLCLAAVPAVNVLRNFAMVMVAVEAVIVLALIDFYRQNRVAIQPLSLRDKIYSSPMTTGHCAMNDDVNQRLVINAVRYGH